MISIFKNFHVRPVPLNIEKTKDLLSDAISNYNDGKRDLEGYIPLDASKVLNHKQIRLELSRYYHNKCAYCEQKNVALVDHYRPKSTYPWLVYEWSNLLPSCRGCNSTKAGKFDVKGRRLTLEHINLSDDVFFANSTLLLKEEPALLHPEVDSPENHIYFASNGNAVGRTERGRYTIDRCGLNRPRLRSLRQAVIKEFQNELLAVVNLFFNGYFKVGGEFIVKSIPTEFEMFFRRLYEKQEAINEFSRLHQAIWQDFEQYVEETLLGIEHRNFQQLLIWKRLFLAKQEKQTASDHSAILSFEIYNIEGLRELQVSNLSPDAKWIFLTGENGYGKSTILKSLAAGLLGNTLSNENFRSKIKVFCPQETFTRINPYGNYDSTTPAFQVKEFVWQSDDFRRLGNVAAYGSNRTKMSKDYSNDGPLDHILDENSYLLNIERYLTDAYNRRSNNNKFNIVVDTLRLIVPQLAKIEIDDSGDILEVKYYELSEDDGRSFSQVSFNQLATGIQSVIALVGDLLCRFLIDTDLSDPSQIEGIVIIDEIDVHLHPKWQRMLPDLLSKAFPKVQFIASTHSPIPLLGSPPGSIFLTVNRSFERGIEIERLKHLENEIDRLTPNLLLSSEIFGYTEVLSANNRFAGKVYTEDTISELAFNRKLSIKLNERLSDEKKSELRQMLGQNNDEE